MHIESSTGRETISIEKLKESDKVLVVDASGAVHYEPVIVLDLHKVDINASIVSIATASGKSISLTSDHMVIVHVGLETELVPAGKVQPGMQIEVVDELGFEKRALTEVVSVDLVDQNSIEGLANVLTASETIVVNGIVGSVLTESCAVRPARKLLKAVNSIMGTRVARSTYRLMEWALNNNYLTRVTI